MLVQKATEIAGGSTTGKDGDEQGGQGAKAQRHGASVRPAAISILKDVFWDHAYRGLFEADSSKLRAWFEFHAGGGKHAASWDRINGAAHYPSVASYHVRFRTLCIGFGLVHAEPDEAGAPLEARPPSVSDDARPQSSEEAEVATLPDEAAPIDEVQIPPDPIAGATGLDPEGLILGERVAYSLYMEGRKAMDAGDIDTAADRFERALRQLPDDRPYARSRGSLALLLALCDSKRYLLDASLAWLDAEEQLLRAYLQRVGEMALDSADREHKEQSVRERLDEIAAERSRRLATPEAADTVLRRSLAGEYEGIKPWAWKPASQDLAWYPRPDDPRPHGNQLNDGEEAPGKPVEVSPDLRKRRRGVGFVALGSVLMASGMAGFAVMATGMAQAQAANSFSPRDTPLQRRQQIAEGQQGNGMGVIGLAAGSTFLVTGTVLLGVGLRRMKRSSQDASRSQLGVRLGFTTAF